MARDGSKYREWALRGFEGPAEALPPGANGKLCKSQGSMWYAWPSDLCTEGDTSVGEGLWPEPSAVVRLGAEQAHRGV